jgi:hypothetical protein
VFQAFRDILDEEGEDEESIEYVSDPYGDEEEEAAGSAPGSSTAR